MAVTRLSRSNAADAILQPSPMSTSSNAADPMARPRVGWITLSATSAVDCMAGRPTMPDLAAGARDGSQLEVQTRHQRHHCSSRAGAAEVLSAMPFEFGGHLEKKG